MLACDRSSRRCAIHLQQLQKDDTSTGSPWKSSLVPSVSAAINMPQHNVSFDATHADPSCTSLQNTTEDAIEKVHTDGVKPCILPYIRRILTDPQAHVSALDLDSHLFDSFIGPEG
jgi:hypothetical protein